MVSHFRKIILFSILTSSTWAAAPVPPSACEFIHADMILQTAEALIAKKLKNSRTIRSTFLRYSKQRVIKKIMAKCAAGCTENELYTHVHDAVESTIRPYKMSAGLAVLISVFAAGNIAQGVELLGPQQYPYLLGVTLLTATAAALFAAPKDIIFAKGKRLSYAFLTKWLKVGEGFNDAKYGRAEGSQQVAEFGEIGVRLRATLDDLAYVGYLRFGALLGAAKGAMKDVGSAFEEPSKNNLRYAAKNLALFMHDARNIPGAVPIDNQAVMDQLKVLLWPQLKNRPELVTGFMGMVKRGLMQVDNTYDPYNNLSSASVWYNNFFRAWRLDGTKIKPEELIDVDPLLGEFVAFDKLGHQELAREESAPAKGTEEDQAETVNPEDPEDL